MPAQCCKDFWARIPEDEPTFTIAGRDLFAVEVIGFWIEMAEAEGVNPDKIRRAKEHLAAIAKFQETHPERTKVPD